MIRRFLVYGVLGALLVGAGFLTFKRLYKKKDQACAHMIEEIERLADIFRHIHESCTIAGFNYQKNPINFLTVQSFVGNEVGSMRLANPQGWQGPYVQEKPTIDGHEFAILHTQKGYFLAPGDGVVLPNGKVVGRDIIISQETDIEALLKDVDTFFCDGKTFGAIIATGQ